MWELFLNGTDEAKDIILKIQERYKFYNHEIFHSPPIEDEQKSTNSTSSNITIQGNIGNLNTGDVNIGGNQIGTQNNQKTESND